MLSRTLRESADGLARDVLLFANSIGCTVDELHFLYVCLDDSEHTCRNQLTNSGTSSQLSSISHLSYHPTYGTIFSGKRWRVLTFSLAFKHTDQEVIDFYARSAATPIPNVPKFDNRRLVDGQRSMTFLKALPPTSAGRIFELRSKVLGVYDKGKAGTVIETETVLAERGGDIYSKAIGSGFFVGQGNWCGPKGGHWGRRGLFYVNADARTRP